MAEVEDYADFGSHFLDSLLEVQMTVEDGEVAVPPEKEEEPAENPYTEFPPIPTFDLQSESFSYKDVFRNPMAVTPPIQPAPMLTIHSKDIMAGNALNPPPLVPTGNYISTTMAPQIITSSVQQAMARPIAKPILASTLKAVNTPKSVTTPTKIISPANLMRETSPDTARKTEFLNKLFKPDYVKVFLTGDPPRDIAGFQNDEMEYYKNHFKNIENVKYCKLHCTICDKHLGNGVDVENKAMVHSYLKVLTCKACFQFYGDGNFPCDEVDNCEIYCRWCGQGGQLVCCSYCPRVFCKKCVRRNYGNAFLRNVEKANDWACFCCSQKPLWPHRAICRALMEYITTRKKTPNNSIPRKDISMCCELTKKKIQLTPQQQQIQHMQQLNLKRKDSSTIPLSSSLKDSPITIISGSDPSKKLILPKTLNNNFKTNFSAIKITDQNKSPIRIVKSVGGVELKNNILRNYNSLPMNKVFTPASIQAPVLHGQTLITPPASRSAGVLRPKPAQVTPQPQPKPQPTPKATPPGQKSPYVMVSLSNQQNAVDLSKIPTAKIPHNVQGLILRMNFPDNKVQLVRLVTEGNGCKAGKTFPMPEFKKGKDSDFLENHLENSFKLNKILFDRLTLIKDKMNSKNKNTESGIYSSSVKKLHVIYEKTSELLKELDVELMKQYEDWKKAKEGGIVDVIDLSDEENKSPKKNNPCNFDEITKELLENADSDIEIIDEEKNLENGEKTEDDDSRSQSDFSDLKDKYNLKELSVKVVRLPAKRRRESEEDEEAKKSKTSDEEFYDAKTDDEGSGDENNETNRPDENCESEGKICENGEVTEEENENKNEEISHSDEEKNGEENVNIMDEDEDETNRNNDANENNETNESEVRNDEDGSSDNLINISNDNDNAVDVSPSSSPPPPPCLQDVSNNENDGEVDIENVE